MSISIIQIRSLFWFNVMILKMHQNSQSARIIYRLAWSSRSIYNHKFMKKYSSLIAIAGLVASLALVAPAFAQTNPAPQSNTNAPQRGAWMGRGNGQMPKVPGVFGTVSAVNGATITVTSQARPNKSGSQGTATTATTYTVDATNAKVTKSGAASSVSSIAVGDTIMVQGTVNGLNVTATTIRDGIGNMQGNRTGKPQGQPQSPIQGNGEPVIGGSVSAINGNTLTVTNKSNVVYTIDVTNASIIKMGTSTAISNLAVGDNLVIQGTVNGTSVTASSVIDQGSTPAPAASGTVSAPKSHPGIFGAIGNFFSRLFGF